METKDISTLSVTELKALAYDVLYEMEINKKNLSIVQQELEKKLKEEKDLQKS